MAPSGHERSLGRRPHSTTVGTVAPTSAGGRDARLRGRTMEVFRERRTVTDPHRGGDSGVLRGPHLDALRTSHRGAQRRDSLAPVLHQVGDVPGNVLRARVLVAGVVGCYSGRTGQGISPARYPWRTPGHHAGQSPASAQDRYTAPANLGVGRAALRLSSPLPRGCPAVRGPREAPVAVSSALEMHPSPSMTDVLKRPQPRFARTGQLAAQGAHSLGA